MKLESNRIFIRNLPETATKEDIQSAFGEYGEVSNVDIKERRELGQNNTSLFFAYISINTDARRLQKCFEDFFNGKWLNNQSIELQVARESFLDRLKKERESNPNINTKVINNTVSNPPINVKNERITNGTKRKINKQESSESSSSSESEEDVQKIENKLKTQQLIIPDPTKEEDIDYVIKNNKGKQNISKVLKIESVGKEPIIKIDNSKKKPTINTSEANLKRLESLKNLKMGYQNQKSLIQAALSNIDTQPKSKIIFQDSSRVSEDNTPKGRNSKSLFMENDSEEEFEPSFAVKEHFQGKQGQKLLELQSKYKNDKRFALDSRFLDEDNEGNHALKQDNFENNTDDISLLDEKKKEYQILEQVLGKKISTKEDKTTPSKKKTMLRFDPSQPEHSKYEIPRSVPQKKEKRKRKDSDNDLISEKKQEDKDAPEVSKEVFFKVSNSLKETFEEKKEFSLLNMFGNQDNINNEELNQEYEEPAQSLTANNNVNSFYKEKNPFRYDSSDDDNDDEPQKFQEVNNTDNSQQLDTSNVRTEKDYVKKLNSWTDPFFFKLDDYRLQEGFDFVEKMKFEEKTEFSKLRRDLKGIVRAKVRNNLRKNKPFKKKLGGNRKKKVLRMKKAMKR